MFEVVFVSSLGWIGRGHLWPCGTLSASEWRCVMSFLEGTGARARRRTACLSNGALLKPEWFS